MCYEISKSTNLVFKHATEIICNEFTDFDDKDPYPNDNSGELLKIMSLLLNLEINMEKLLELE